jgi:hypothetical protein
MDNFGGGVLESNKDNSKNTDLKITCIYKGEENIKDILKKSFLLFIQRELNK